MRHEIADTVGAPAEGELGEIAGTEHDRIVMIGEAEEQGRTCAGLDVLEGYVMHLLSAGEWMIDVLEHLPAGGCDVDLKGADAECLHQPVRLIARASAGGEARQRIGQDIRARQPEPVKGMRRNKQRLGGIESTRDADDDALMARSIQALAQTLRLDIVSFIA